MSFDPRPTTLEGTDVRLEPLGAKHAEDLYAVGREDAIWSYMPRPAFRNPEDAAVRVQLKTDGRNVTSQRAMERIGAVREGTLRRQRLTWDGHMRDTVYYSVLDSEWPTVKRRLQSLMRR